MTAGPSNQHNDNERTRKRVKCYIGNAVTIDVSLYLSNFLQVLKAPVLFSSEAIEVGKMLKRNGCG